MNLLKIDLPETALVVIDLQKGIVAIPVQPHPAATVIANAAKLAEAFRQKQMPSVSRAYHPHPTAKTR
jgi:nicotinamidase-related amidase